MLVLKGPPDCAGNAIARELLATSRRVVRSRDSYGPELVDMAHRSITFAIGWLRRCRLCRQGRSCGKPALCGASSVSAGC